MFSQTRTNIVSKLSCACMKMSCNIWNVFVMMWKQCWFFFPLLQEPLHNSCSEQQLVQRSATWVHAHSARWVHVAVWVRQNIVNHDIFYTLFVATPILQKWKLKEWSETSDFSVDWINSESQPFMRNAVHTWKPLTCFSDIFFLCLNMGVE